MSGQFGDVSLVLAQNAQAIAETIFGDNNPSGKLTQTWYPADYVNQCSMFDM